MFPPTSPMATEDPTYHDPTEEIPNLPYLEGQPITNFLPPPPPKMYRQPQKYSWSNNQGPSQHHSGSPSRNLGLYQNNSGSPNRNAGSFKANGGSPVRNGGEYISVQRSASVRDESSASRVTRSVSMREQTSPSRVEAGEYARIQRSESGRPTQEQRRGGGRGRGLVPKQ